MKRSIVALLVLAACSGSRTPAAAPPTATPAEPIQGTREAPADPAPEASEAPAGVAGLQELLAAWHAEDLPDRTALDKHEGAQESLVWLGQNADTMVTRVRALKLLALYPDADVATMLHGLASDAGNHAAIRAGAIHGLSGQELTDAMRQTVEQGLDDPDARVKAAAELALED